MFSGSFTRLENKSLVNRTWHWVNCIIIPGPSKRCQMDGKGCHEATPSGLNTTHSRVLVQDYSIIQLVLLLKHHFCGFLCSTHQLQIWLRASEAISVAEMLDGPHQHLLRPKGPTNKEAMWNNELRWTNGWIKMAVIMFCRFRRPGRY